MVAAEGAGEGTGVSGRTFCDEGAVHTCWAEAEPAARTRAYTSDRTCGTGSLPGWLGKGRGLSCLPTGEACRLFPARCAAPGAVLLVYGQSEALLAHHPTRGAKSAFEPT